MDQDRAKHTAAERAVDSVQTGMIVGLGTGSTARYAIELLGERVRQGLDIRGVPTSVQTQRLAESVGIPILEEFDAVDLTIDGADEADRSGNLIKGGGGALTREKIVAAASAEVLIIVDPSKPVETLGSCPLPVEVLPFGWRFVQRRLRDFGCEPVLRTVNGKPFVSDNQNYILDCTFGAIDEPQALSARLDAIPGVIQHGLFVGLATRIIIGHEDGTAEDVRVVSAP